MAFLLLATMLSVNLTSCSDKSDEPDTPSSEENNTEVNTYDKKKYTVASISFNMVKVKGGTFVMGTRDTGDDDERPSHPVTLSDYYIGETEVTQGLWESVMKYSGKCADGTTMSAYGSGVWLNTSPSLNRGLGVNHPAYHVSHNDIMDVFLPRLIRITGQNFRLPTEAEWEYAARGGNNRNGYTYSGSNNLSDVAWYSDNANYVTHKVATKASNELGVYDMSGNVWEWCADWYDSDYYSSSPTTNPTGPYTGSKRVLRGGGIYNNERDCRVSIRFGSEPNNDRYSTIEHYYYLFGFRLACDL